MRIRFFVAALAVLFLFNAMTVYAQDGTGGPVINGGPVEARLTPPPIIPVTEQAPTARPFTPPGTGTVVDNVTNEDGKEFFTISSAAGNIFFLIIDRQRETENVYFLNAVTERDLLALAKEAGETWETVNTPPPVIPVPTPMPDPVVTTPEPEQSNSNMGLVILLAVVIVGGGGAGWYFKIYRRKQQDTESEDDFDYEDGADTDDPYGADINAISSWDVEDEAE
jgi:hypothetical protein